MFLQWYSVPGAVGYKVYRSDTSDVKGMPLLFALVADVASASGLNDTSIVDRGATTGIRYYYYLEAYGHDNTYSSRSDTVDYELLQRPYIYPWGNSPRDDSKLVFNWVDRISGGYIVLRVKDVSDIPSQYVWITPRFQMFGSSESYAKFNFDSTAISQLVSGHFYKWRVDRFGVDSTGRPYEGARSVWTTFSVK